MGYATSDEKRRRAGSPKAVCSEHAAAQKAPYISAARTAKESCYFALLLRFSYYGRLLVQTKLTHRVPILSRMLVV